MLCVLIFRFVILFGYFMFLSIIWVVGCFFLIFGGFWRCICIFGGIVLLWLFWLLLFMVFCLWLVFLGIFVCVLLLFGISLCILLWIIICLIWLWWIFFCWWLDFCWIYILFGCCIFGCLERCFVWCVFLFVRFLLIFLFWWLWFLLWSDMLLFVFWWRCRRCLVFCVWCVWLFVCGLWLYVLLF